MKRIVLSIAVIIILGAAGFGAYTLGNRIGSSPSNVEITGTAFQNPIDVSEVTLKTAGDLDVSLKDYAGKVTLVFFGFTRCPDVCPITLGRLDKMMTDYELQDDVQVVMITVDPDFDTPEITHNYTSAFNETFVGLSGSNQEVAKVLETFFIGAGQNADGSIFHTDVVFVVNRESGVKYLYGQSNLEDLPSNVAALVARSDW